MFVQVIVRQCCLTTSVENTNSLLPVTTSTTVFILQATCNFTFRKRISWLRMLLENEDPTVLRTSRIPLVPSGRLEKKKSTSDTVPRMLLLKFFTKRSIRRRGNWKQKDDAEPTSKKNYHCILIAIKDILVLLINFVS